MALLHILQEYCVGCELCVQACPYGAIKLKKGEKAVINDQCTFCGACISACKLDAIQSAEEEKMQAPTAQSLYRGVWIFAEQKSGVPAKVVLELLGEGRRLTDILQTKLSAVLIGHGVRDAAEVLFSYGADQVYLVDHPSTGLFSDEIYAEAMVQLVNQYKPEILLMGATGYGRSLAPRVASRLNTGLTADCIRLEIEPERKILQQIRPAFGGNMMASIISPCHRPQMATVRANVMKPLKVSESRLGEVVIPEIRLPDHSATRIIECVEYVRETADLTEADIIVAGGRGMGSLDSFKLLRELADVLGGAVGATRAVIDCGWMDYFYQIGQTGKTVNPKIYFACGISGAAQHLAGMCSSDVIVAINNDPDAPIFKYATYGIVGDVLKVIPELILEFSKFLKKSC